MNLLSLLLLALIPIVLSDNNYELLIQVIHRHGDRTPISFYPNDKNKNDSLYQLNGLGELTNQGKKRMFYFGKRLRQRYDSSIGNDPREVRVKSSASRRCLETAAMVMAGVYYEPKQVGKEESWNWCSSQDSCHELSRLWQPVAIETRPPDSDGLLRTNSYCPAAEDEYLNVMRSKETQELLRKNKEAIKEIGDFTGDKYDTSPGATGTLRKLDWLYNNIKIENHTLKSHEKAWGEWDKFFSKDNKNITYRKVLKEMEEKAFLLDYSTQKIQRLRAGMLLNEIGENMKTFVKNVADSKNRKSDQVYPKLIKFFDYSTHDTMLVALMQALKVYNSSIRHPPGYGAAIIIEFNATKDCCSDNWVNISYVDQPPEDETSEMKLKHLIYKNLTQFLGLTKSFAIDESQWLSECRTGDQSSSGMSDGARIGISLGIGVGVMVVLIIVGLACWNSRKKSSKKMADVARQVDEFKMNEEKQRVGFNRIPRVRY